MAKFTNFAEEVIDLMKIIRRADHLEQIIAKLMRQKAREILFTK